MPLQATSGAASYDAFGGGVPVVPNYIEDVFSTYLYTANNSAQTITNGIDLAGKGGLVWGKSRSASQNHRLYDTARGSSFSLISNATSAESNQGTNACAFNANGFSLSAASGIVGGSGFGGPDYVSWTFRKQPKFFDVVTFTSASSGNTTFSHNLGSTPGCVFIKNTQTSDPWIVYHTSVGNDAYLQLNSTAVQDPLTGAFSATSTTFTISSSLMYTSQTYVAYVFAHNAGGFGLTGTDNVISCGSYTGTFTAGLEVNLGYEPQWVMIKRRSGVTGNWFLFDNMRGMPNGSADAYLYANTSAAEANFEYIAPTATGFKIDSTTGGLNASGGSYIYIAIRRGPMKVPTSGTSVFNTLAHTGDAGGIEVTGVGFPPDLLISKWRSGISGTQEAVFLDRLRGTGKALFSDGTGSENSWEAYVGPLGQDGVKTTTAQNAIINKTGDNNAWWFMKRGPSFFDEVCYTSAVAATNHNLGIAPELVIVKTRGSADSWAVFVAQNGYGFLDSTSAWAGTGNGSGLGVNLANATITTIDALGSFFGSGSTLVAYLFATCAGVSKVFSYTGNGSSQTINCGFTGGARFVLIKRTDSTGDWYVWDSARGIVSGNDPHLSLNTTAAEVTTDDTIDTNSTGFVVNQVSATNVNVSSATYIGLAIA